MTNIFNIIIDAMFDAFYLKKAGAIWEINFWNTWK